MPLNNNHVELLEQSILGYEFPTIYRDFETGEVVRGESMAEVESMIQDLLLSEDLARIKFGLANVIFWGNANAGYRDHRVNQFLNSVTNEQIDAFRQLLTAFPVPSARQIRNLKIPGYSGLSFITKVVAFLDPDNFCVLDLQIVRLGVNIFNRALANISYTTQISTTVANCASYLAWCDECSEISRIYYGSRYRVVDVERGFFNLIQTNRLALAQQIYQSAL